MCPFALRVMSDKSLSPPEILPQIESLWGPASSHLSRVPSQQPPGSFHLLHWKTLVYLEHSLDTEEFPLKMFPSAKKKSYLE